MDHLWSPWRFQYVSKASASTGCIFCAKCSDQNDEENFIVHRGERNFIILNLFPYSTGHLMVAPYRHLASLSEAEPAEVEEMIRLARTAERHLRSIYKPDGLNLGMNVGASAGAGVPGHIHLHVLPRWGGDTNFMTTVGETRVLPETLEATYVKLIKQFRENPGR